MNNRWILGELALECCFYAMSRSARRILKVDPKDDSAYVHSYQCRMDSNEIQLSCRPPHARTVTLMSFYHLLTRDLLARPFAIGILKLIIVTRYESTTNGLLSAIRALKYIVSKHVRLAESSTIVIIYILRNIIKLKTYTCSSFLSFVVLYCVVFIPVTSTGGTTSYSTG